MKKLEGDWYVPERQDTSVHGLLTQRDDGRFELNLSGSLEGRQKAPLPDVKIGTKYDTIFGVTPDGLVTLFDTRLVEVDSPVLLFEESYYGMNRTRLIAHTVVVGGHFNSKGEIVPTGIQVEYSNLAEWMGGPVFELDFERLKVGDISVFVKRPNIVECAPREGVTVSFGTTLIPPARKSVNRDICVITNRYVKMVVPGAKLLDYSFHVRIVADLLSLLIGHPVGPKAIFVAIPEEAKKNKSTRSIVEWSYPYGRGDDGCRTILPSEAVVPYLVIEDGVSELMSKWYEVRDKLGPAVDLYLMRLRDRDMAAETRFLLSVQSLESLHRNWYAETDKPVEEFEIIRTEILNSCPSIHKVYLEDKLRWANEASFRRRLRTLFREQEAMIDFLLAKSDENRFIEKTVNTRNLLTHHDRRKELEYFEGPDLVRAIHLLERIELVEILSKTGIPKETLAKLMMADATILR